MNSEKIAELQRTAFTKMLKSFGPEAGFAHFVDCLRHGGEDQIAYEVMDAVFGESWIINSETVTRAYDALVSDDPS